MNLLNLVPGLLVLSRCGFILPRCLPQHLRDERLKSVGVFAGELDELRSRGRRDARVWGVGHRLVRDRGRRDASHLGPVRLGRRPRRALRRQAHSRAVRQERLAEPRRAVLFARPEHEVLAHVIGVI